MTTEDIRLGFLKQPIQGEPTTALLLSDCGYKMAQASSGAIMAQPAALKPAPLKYVFYIAATPEKVWEGFVSPESNRILFAGAEFRADFKPGGSLAWVGTGPDGKPVNYVQGKVLRFEPPRVFQYTFAMGQNDKPSRATIELVPETEATQVTVTHDEWAGDDPTYVACSDGWPRILSRLKTLLETGKTFKPH
jgi:uncharacterized protein YndB with AHSA1/START domain